MNKILLALLCASLAGNAVLLWRRHPAASADKSRIAVAAKSPNPANAATATAAPIAAHASRAAPWVPPKHDNDLKALIADLRQAGYPTPVVRAIVNQLLTDEFYPRMPVARLPFWQDSLAEPRLAVEFRALEREKAERLEALLGPDGRPSALLDPAGRERRYGNLSPEKIDVIARIERDYEDLRWKQAAERTGRNRYGGEETQQQDQLMEKEMMADLAGVLTKDELEQYQMRTSRQAAQLKSALRGITVSPEEFTALYRAQRRFDEAHVPPTGTVSAEAWNQRQQARLTFNEEVRGLLPDERFYSYVAASDFNFAQLLRFTAKYPQVTPATSYEVYRIQTDAQAKMMAWSARRDQPMEQRLTEMRQAGAAYEAQIKELLGPEAAEAYLKQGQGRTISTMANPRAPRPPGG
jgi:hypothetical protein